MALRAIGIGQIHQRRRAAAVVAMARCACKIWGLADMMVRTRMTRLGTLGAFLEIVAEKWGGPRVAADRSEIDVAGVALGAPRLMHGGDRAARRVKVELLAECEVYPHPSCREQNGEAG
jgi:hypothetical protein